MRRVPPVQRHEFAPSRESMRLGSIDVVYGVKSRNQFSSCPDVCPLRQTRRKGQWHRNSCDDFWNDSVHGKRLAERAGNFGPVGVNPLIPTQMPI